MKRMETCQSIDSLQRHNKVIDVCDVVSIFSTNEVMRNSYQPKMIYFYTEWNFWDISNTFQVDIVTDKNFSSMFKPITEKQFYSHIIM